MTSNLERLKKLASLIPTKKKNETMITMNCHVFYRDVYVFVDRFRDMAFLRKKNRLKIVISQCLRGSALMWHFMKLSDMKKEYFKIVILNQWKHALIYRFKKRTFMTLTKLQNVKYIMTDARIEKNSRNFAQDIFRHVKVAHLNSVQNQSIMTWNVFDCEFRF